MKKENTQVGFSIIGIKTEQFAIIEENYSPGKETELGTELQFKLDQTNKQIGVFLGLEFSHDMKIFLKLQVSCHFKINEGSWDSLIHENKLILPKGFLAHLAMITTGTSRGVLHVKTEASVYSKFIVPTLNVAEMIKEDASFELIHK